MNINSIQNYDLNFQARIKINTQKAKNALEKTVTVVAPTALLATGIDYWNNGNTSIQGQLDSVYPASVQSANGSTIDAVRADSLWSHGAPFVSTALPMAITGSLSPAAATALSSYNSAQFDKAFEAEKTDRKIPD